MSYPVVIGQPDSSRPALRDRKTDSSPPNNMNRVPVVRRFPPVLLFITRTEQHIEKALQTICLRAFRAERSIDHICGAIYQAALSMGYLVTIGVQEIFSNNMPSFPHETVMSALLMIDFTPMQS